MKIIVISMLEKVNASNTIGNVAPEWIKNLIIQ